MKARTLGYIYNLLVQNEAAASKAESVARTAMNKAKGESSPDSSTLYEEHARLQAAWKEAKAALEDFDSHSYS